MECHLIGAAIRLSHDNVSRADLWTTTIGAQRESICRMLTFEMSDASSEDLSVHIVFANRGDPGVCAVVSRLPDEMVFSANLAGSAC